ncbi:MAG: ParB/RepB/Spo0J family partition protein [bacterium]|nr:ParB/RepB/Spo0J family partition protein [bacterium]
MQSNEEVVYLYLDDIIPNRFQPREVFDERPLKELAVSIKEHGVIQPIIVRKVNDKYEIIAGERRYKASALAGLTKIPAIIRDLDDKETSKVALLENLQRKNLNPIEEAKTYQKILELDQMTQEELAKTMGKSQSAVANKLRLLSLPEEVQDALLKENISERHARTLLNLKTPQEQKDMLKKIMDERLTVRQVENLIKGDSKEEEKEVLNLNENKSNTEVLDLPKSEDVPTESNYIPINPIMPNFDGENNDLNTPILTNIPSNTQELNQEEDESGQPRFINFGEISKEDDTDSLDEANDNTSIDIDKLKEEANDINSNLSSENEGLDSLLKIGDPIDTDNSDDKDTSEFKFFSPAREAIKESEKTVSNDKTEDYFKAPDLVSVNLPDSVQTNNVNGISLSNEDLKLTPDRTREENPMNSAIEIIRNSLSQIENMGIKVEKDEMSLENSYQIVIKLEK